MNPTLPPAHPAPPTGAPSRRRLLAFLAVLLACVLGAAGYAAHVVWRARAAAAASGPVASVPISSLPAQGPFLLYRSTALGESYGRVGLGWLEGGDTQRYITPLACERVHYAAGHGICLEARRGAITSYHALLFDRELAVRKTLALAGPPSRARVSPNGRLAAMTVFLTGHSYASTDFTTRSTVLDAASGQTIVEDLEQWPVERDGQAFKAADFNFWGITFAADGKRFYATLGTGGKTFLVEADLAARRLRVLHADVECPSLSPDNTRVAFKRRMPADGWGRFVWRLHVLELASGREIALALETRNVDDQVEWLGNGEVIYAQPDEGPEPSAATRIWALAADGKQAPRLLMPLAFSPAVVP